jgi:hypothetical protein
MRQDRGGKRLALKVAVTPAEWETLGKVPLSPEAPTPQMAAGPGQ